jgi:hypothetical protein
VTKAHYSTLMPHYCNRIPVPRLRRGDVTGIQPRRVRAVNNALLDPGKSLSRART